MLRFFYTLFNYLAQPLVLLMMLKRSLKAPKYRQRIWERYGLYPHETKPKPDGIVIHAASVGEVIAVTPLIKAIQQHYPALPITITTITPTGSDRVISTFGNTVYHYYLPYDLPDAIKRFLKFVRPKAFIVVETELWPNLIRQVSKKQIPFIVANARLSPRSAKRYGWIKPILKNMFNDISLILAQDSVSEARYLSLGFATEKLVNTGNLKFDLSVNEKLYQKIQHTEQQLQITDRPIWIAASTHEGEENLILAAHQLLLAQYPNLLLILVPRHPERFEPVAQMIKKVGMNYTTRTSHSPILPTDQVMLGDTMGEMMLFYGLSDIAFVGGSLVKHGGHNPLEPIAFKIPVISGIYTFNFPEVFDKLREVNGVIEIASTAEALAESVDFLFKHPKQKANISLAAFDVLKENQGALQRHLNLLSPYFAHSKNE